MIIVAEVLAFSKLHSEIKAIFPRYDFFFFVVCCKVPCICHFCQKNKQMPIFQRRVGTKNNGRQKTALAQNLHDQWSIVKVRLYATEDADDVRVAQLPQDRNLRGKVLEMDCGYEAKKCKQCSRVKRIAVAKRLPPSSAHPSLQRGSLLG
jgi:hypothetical protein